MRILIIEDDVVHSQILSQKLKELGYNNVVVANTYNDATILIAKELYDIYFIDFYLDKGFTGLDIYNRCLKSCNVPTIFHSSVYDATVFDKIKTLGNIDFISKNASLFDIQKSIELAVAKSVKTKNQYSLDDFLLVKKGKTLVKININDIEYIDVDGKYLQIHISNSHYLIRSTLSDFIEKLPNSFIRTHQSICINTIFLDSVNSSENTVDLKGNILPISRNYKKELIANYYKA